MMNLTKTFWRGTKDFHEAWQLSNGTVRAVVTRLGGHLALVSDDADDQLNPMWQPHWQSKDPSLIPYDGVKGLKRGWIMSKHFGGGEESALLAGIVGHNLCIDRFGGPHSYMVQQGKLMKEKYEWKPVHGEAGVLPWVLSDQGADYAQFSVNLPEAKLKVTRTYSLDGSTISLGTEVTPLDGESRDIEWCEHVTVGDPFMDGAQIEASIDGAWLAPLDGMVSRFPNAAGLDSVDPAAALALPAADADPCGDVIAARATEGAFKVTNMGRTLGYQWDLDTFPWLCLWTEHKSRTDLPWEGVERTRGLEFSTKPFPEGKPPSERAIEFEGTSTVCHIPASGRSTEIKITWE